MSELRELWAGDDVGPDAPGGPTLVLGGSVSASFRRAAEYGSGWMMGGGTPDMFKEALPKLEAAARRRPGGRAAQAGARRPASVSRTPARRYARLRGLDLPPSSARSRRAKLRA